MNIWRGEAYEFTGQLKHCSKKIRIIILIYSNCHNVLGKKYMLKHLQLDYKAEKQTIWTLEKK